MTLYVLNLLDLLSALTALSMGAVEMNPIMNALIGIHPALFALVKLIPAYFLCRWLRDRKSYKTIVCIYAAVVTWNIYNITLIGGMTI